MRQLLHILNPINRNAHQTQHTGPEVRKQQLMTTRSVSMVFLLCLLVCAHSFADNYTLPQYQLPNQFLYAVPKKPEAPPAPPKHIVMYSSEFCNRCESSETCKPCALAKAFFKEHGLAYEEYNISESPINWKQYQRLGGGTLPLIFVNGKRMQGFRKGLFEETYQAAPEKPEPYKPAGEAP